MDVVVLPKSQIMQFFVCVELAGNRFRLGQRSQEFKHGIAMDVVGCGGSCRGGHSVAIDSSTASATCPKGGGLCAQNFATWLGHCPICHFSTPGSVSHNFFQP